MTSKEACELLDEIWQLLFQEMRNSTFKDIQENGKLNKYMIAHNMALIALKKEIEINESEEMIKCCVTCKYHHHDGAKEPCVSCIRNCFSSDDGVTGWERKE